MKRRQFMAATGLAPLAGQAATTLSQTDAASGVRAALQRGAEAAVDLLGRDNGFLGNPKVKIPLPGYLNDAAKLLKTLGQGRKVDDLVTAMNRAAEAAVPEARTLLVDTAKSIGVDDAVRIVRGGATSVTDWFAARTRAPLRQQFLPIVTRATEKVALAERYESVAAKAQSMGLVKKEDADLRQYVTTRALEGLFLVIGEEEMKIRSDPVGTGSALLRKVFGG